MKMQQSSSLHSGQLSKYGAGPLSENLSSLQQITISSHREKFNDPLGVAERGKVGLPPSSSECSSNSSADASVESNVGILNCEKKGKSKSVFPSRRRKRIKSGFRRSASHHLRRQIVRLELHVDDVEGDQDRQPSRAQQQPVVAEVPSAAHPAPSQHRPLTRCQQQ